VTLRVRRARQAGRGSCCCASRSRYRHRHRRRSLPRLFSRVRTGRQLDHPQVRRHRAGPGDHAAPGRADGWRGRRQQHAGRGSTFWFTARLKKGGERRLHGTARFRMPRIRSAQNMPDARVLLADDEPINREVSLSILEDIGLVVDGRRWRDRLGTWRTQPLSQLILMDMQMPRIDGLEATRAGYANCRAGIPPPSWP
jgi:hypothetical protein